MPVEGRTMERHTIVKDPSLSPRYWEIDPRTHARFVHPGVSAG